MALRYHRADVWGQGVRDDTDNTLPGIIDVALLDVNGLICTQVQFCFLEETFP